MVGGLGTPLVSHAEQGGKAQGTARWRAATSGVHKRATARAALGPVGGARVRAGNGMLGSAHD